MRKYSTRAVIYSALIIMVLLCGLPNVLPTSIVQSLPDWYEDNQLNLGLDLQGGSHLLLEINVEQLMLDGNQQFAEELTTQLQMAGIRYQRPQISAESININIRNQNQLQDGTQIARQLSNEFSTTRAYDIDTVDSEIILDLNRVYQEERVSDALEQSLEVVRRRIDESGMVDSSITPQGYSSIVVQLPGVSEPQRVRELLGTTAKLSFHLVADVSNVDVMVLPGTLPAEQYSVEREIVLDGEHIKDARSGYHPDTGTPVVNFQLDNSGGKKFGELTGNNPGRLFAMVLDDQVIMAPRINDPILGGSVQITGSFTASETADLAVMLRAGALPAELNIVEERSVGANLGSDTIRMGVISGLAGGLLVLFSMIAAYRQWGLISWLGLSVNLGLMFSILTLFGATLTLPGIGGIILGIGMAVDANILINERIREELQQGERASNAVQKGFSRAWSTILDSNITTLIAVSLLFTVGSGPVRGFAITIGIGLVTSMFTTITITRLLMEMWARRLGKKSLQGQENFIDRFSKRYGKDGKVINFMRASSAGLIISAILSIASIGLMFSPGMEYGIDFSGGVLVEVNAPSTSIEDLRNGMEVLNAESISIQEFGSDGDFQLRMPVQNDEVDSGELIESIKSGVLLTAPEADFPRVELVGSRVSADFADLSIMAVISAGIGMLVYLWFRFESHFALAATITTALDLTKTIGFFVITGVEFNLTAVAALLALIGYSINDKVVVFDRIRENLYKDPELPLEGVLNRSITNTLTRTLLTSGSTFLAILPMAIIGGSAVASFALPMLFGVVISTSSSIFIAAPIVLWLGNRREKRGLPQLQPKGLSEVDLMRP